MSQQHEIRPQVGLCAFNFADNTATTILKCSGALSSELDRASALKMCRSVIIKWAEALLIESLVADRRHGVESSETESLLDLFPGVDRDNPTYYTIGKSIHQGRRREEELKSVRSKAADAGPDSSTGWAGTVRQPMSSRFDAPASENGLESSLNRVPATGKSPELMRE